MQPAMQRSGFATGGGMDPEIVYLDDLRLKRYELFDRLQLAIAAIALVMSSLERLEDPGPKDLVLAILQLLASLAVIASIVVWVRTRQAPPASRVGWLDLLAGLMLLIEWADRYLGTGRVLTPVLCQAAIFIALGLLHTRIAQWRRRWRYARVDDNGISLRRSAIRKRHVAWTEVASVSHEPQAIRITKLDSTVCRLSLRRLGNADEVARLVLDAAIARGLVADETSCSLPGR
jgi:hypothetical protein